MLFTKESENINRSILICYISDGAIFYFQKGGWAYRPPIPSKKDSRKNHSLQIQNRYKTNTKQIQPIFRIVK